MIRSFFFVLRLVAAWGIALLVPLSIFTSASHTDPHPLILIPDAVLLVVVMVAGWSHTRRVKLIAGEVNSRTLANRQRTQIEIPFEANEAFELLAAAISCLSPPQTHRCSPWSALRRSAVGGSCHRAIRR